MKPKDETTVTSLINHCFIGNFSDNLSSCTSNALILKNEGNLRVNLKVISDRLAIEKRLVKTEIYIQNQATVIHNSPF